MRPLITITSKAKADADACIVCPHCQTRGLVSTCRASHKAGISGGKATVALLTFGMSLPLTGLSRRQRSTKAKCGLCRSRWRF